MNKLKIIFVMMVWGSVGVFSRYIPLSPIFLAFCRALLSVPVLLVLSVISKDKYINCFKLQEIKPFILSGVLIGFAWLSLFTAFKYTSIATATLAYNMCPVYVLILAPKLLKEKLKVFHIINVVLAITGLIMIVMTSLNKNYASFKGISFGILSGLLYAFIVIINRKSGSLIKATSSTLIQMISASSILLPFVFIGSSWGELAVLNEVGIIMLIILGVIHTGVGFLIYFSTYKLISAITIALLSYLEPVFSIIFSIIIIGEELSVWQVLGGLLILGSTVLGEVINSNKLIPKLLIQDKFL